MSNTKTYPKLEDWTNGFSIHEDGDSYLVMHTGRIWAYAHSLRRAQDELRDRGYRFLRTSS